MANTHPSPRKRRPRVLPVLAMLFAFGAALRIASGFSAAFAQDPTHANTPTTAHTNTPSDPTVSPMLASANVPAPPPTTESFDASAQIVVDLRRRELSLQEREAALNERDVLVAAAQDRLQAQILALQTAEQDLSATMALADRASEEDITRLVSVFEAMGSEQAAAVFSEMAPDFAAGFLGRLTPATAAAILSGLDPRQAYGLSAILAGRNALVPHN